jgi:hypothetical protein
MVLNFEKHMEQISNKKNIGSALLESTSPGSGLLRAVKVKLWPHEHSLGLQMAAALRNVYDCGIIGIASARVFHQLSSN